VALSTDPDSDGVSVRLLEGEADAAAFRALNEEWIARHFAIEERDRRQLGDPVAAYVVTGGAILVAELDGVVVGCVALAPHGTGAIELSKMAVSVALRGRGIGRKLLGAAIEEARARGARSLFLGSSTKLPSAVNLYESFGFRHVARETLSLTSTRIDVFMELVLGADDQPRGGEGVLRTRDADADDLGLLACLLGQAVVWQPHARPMEAATVLATPGLAHYLEGWPREGDHGVVAVRERPLGAAWWRQFSAAAPGYGYLAGDVPELAMAVLAPWRGQGVGTLLLQDLIAGARSRGLRALSLTVHHDNPARRLYERLGFAAVGDVGGAVTMLLEL